MASATKTPIVAASSARLTAALVRVDLENPRDEILDAAGGTS